jgi:hypothetical protein
MDTRHALLAFSAASLATLLFSGTVGPSARADTKGSRRVVRPMTVTSIVDPVPGHADHQLALLLPPDPDRVYSGTLTYTASKPVEVVVFHAYEADREPDPEHGNVVVVSVDGKRYAVSLMQFSNDVKVTNSATTAFTGNGLALHTLNGDKFTATATVQAIQEPRTR